MRIINRILIAAVLLIAGGVLVTSSVKDGTSALAQSGGNYVTTWQAQQYINITGHGEGGPTLGPVTIGITKWRNETRQNGALVYAEDWTADVPAGNIVAGRSGGTPTLSAFNRSSWIYGVAGLNITDGNPYTFSFTTAPAAERTMNDVGRQNMTSIGNSSHCIPSSGNADCLAATGAYGFTVADLMGDGINQYPSGYGMMMPSKWTVTGTVY